MMNMTMKDFLKVNLGHVLVIATWMVSFSYEYGNLNQRVTNTEKEIISIQLIQKEVTEKIIAEQKKNSEQMANLNNKVAAMANDLEWIKRNIK